MVYKKISGLLACLLAAVISFFVVASPAFAEALPQHWFKVCNQQNGVCNVLSTVFSDIGQPLTTVNIVEMQGANPSRHLRIVVPTDRLIQEGVRIQIGKGPVRKAEYLSCVGPSCIADAPLNDELIKEMSNAADMVVTSVNFLGTPNPITVSMNGFSQVFSSKGMDELTYQNEQEKIFQMIEKKNKDFDSKIKAAQEKAKNKN